MAARTSQIRAYRILSILAILHSAIVLGLRFGNYVWSWFWLGLATSLFLWLLGLALHPGRSILRFLIPTIVAAALFVPCVPVYGALIRYSIERFRPGEIHWGQWNAANDLRPQWTIADDLENLMGSNPRIVLYSIDAESSNAYRQVEADEVILPDDTFTDFHDFVRMDESAESVRANVGKTVNSISDATVRSSYGEGWVIIRKKANGLSEADAGTEATPDPGPNKFDREPYKASGVLGYAEITDRTEQWELITALASGARDGGDSALCHYPRHGLYVETATLSIKFSICFECNNVYAFGEEMGPFADVGGFAIPDAPQSVLNATLQRHGVPVPPSPTPFD